jgi:hypothetical protein
MVRVTGRSAFLTRYSRSLGCKSMVSRPGCSSPECPAQGGLEESKSRVYDAARSEADRRSRVIGRTAPRARRQRTDQARNRRHRLRITATADPDRDIAQRRNRHPRILLEKQLHQQHNILKNQRIWHGLSTIRVPVGEGSILLYST